MKNLLIKLKQYDIFILKKKISSFEVFPLDGEKIEFPIFMFNIFKNDYIFSTVSISEKWKNYIFIKKEILPKLKCELFLETTFKHSMYFMLNYDERKLYNFFLPIYRTQDQNEFLTVPDFGRVSLLLERFKIKVNIRLTADIKYMIQRINKKDDFFSLCEKFLEEHEYDEVRLLWEIL